MPAPKLSVAMPKTEAGTLRKFLRARQLALRAEQVKKALDPLVREIVARAPGKVLDFGVSTLALIAVSGGRSFNVERAIEVLGKRKLQRFFDMKPVFNVERATEVLGPEMLAPFWEEKQGTERLIVK